jgi:hypothetical protein
VNHRRQILHSTTGHPGRWNDKTLVRFDSFMADLRNGAFNNTMSFELKTNTDGETTTRIIKGAYVIVDNGYLKWSTAVPPIKHSCQCSVIRFSQWLESLRKDVECTFGILKGRRRVLKSGIRVHNTEAADNIWLTCCALHNLLTNHESDQVHGEIGQHSTQYRGHHHCLPNTARQFSSFVELLIGLRHHKGVMANQNMHMQLMPGTR